MKIEIFTSDVREHLIRTTGDTAVVLQDFRDRLNSRLTDTQLVILAKYWIKWDGNSRKEISLNHIDENHLLRFMILMDYLSKKINEEER